MADHGPSKLQRRGHITDARGRKVTQLDPVALHLLHRHEAIPGEDLRAIAGAIDPAEVRRRPRMRKMGQPFVPSAGVRGG